MNEASNVQINSCPYQQIFDFDFSHKVNPLINPYLSIYSFQVPPASAFETQTSCNAKKVCKDMCFGTNMCPNRCIGTCEILYKNNQIIN